MVSLPKTKSKGDLVVKPKRVSKGDLYVGNNIERGG